MKIELKKKIEAQKEFCERTEAPFFAPYDGICWACHHQVFDRLTEDQCKNSLITGCPWCNRSYCD